MQGLYGDVQGYIRIERDVYGIHICITDIYIYRERERERERQTDIVIHKGIPAYGTQKPPARKQTSQDSVGIQVAATKTKAQA